MRTIVRKAALVPAVAVALALCLPVGEAAARIDGVTGPAFSFTATRDYISSPEGGSWLIWGYRNVAAPPPFHRAQYPGPTMIVNEGDTVTVTLTNNLAEPVSIIFPGQAGVTAAGGLPGLLTREAAPRSSTTATPAQKTVTYSFVAANPGTFLYYSGSHAELQVEMGLLGALIVRPLMGPNFAYNHADSRFDRETLFLLTEIDPGVHAKVDAGRTNAISNAARTAKYWFINGRMAPDDMQPAFVDWLPTQPYNSMPIIHPGERLLMRVVNLGRDLHPFHFHGNHARVIAQDGRLLSSAPGSGADLSHELFTIQSVPGETDDAIFQWTGKDLGWDPYGPVVDDTVCTDDDNDGLADNPADPTMPMHCHDADCVDNVNNDTGVGPGDGFDDATYEWCADHGTPIPVTLPGNQDVTFGGWYQGSPFLGSVPLGGLPPGQGGLNPTGAFVFMWHSHTEKELTNYDIFPGGMMTMLFVEPFGTPIME